MKVEVFDFEKHWRRVQPHLKKRDVREALKIGMSQFFRYVKRRRPPVWDLRKNSGPWHYTPVEAHSDYAFNMTMKDPALEVVGRKFEKILEKEGLDWNVLNDVSSKNPKIRRIAKAYEKERNKIGEKYWPKRNTYRWYQCFFAAAYLADWHKKLAKRLFPAYEWRTFDKYNKKGWGCTTTIGKNAKGDFLIFDILLFNSDSVTSILKAVGLDRNKLKRKFK